MKTIIIECLIIGLISAICCIISYNVINPDEKKTNYFKNPKTRNNIIMCFFMGMIVHYIIKESGITNFYCKKVCYGDKCFMVCPI